MTKTVKLYCVFHIEEDGNEPVLLHAFDNQDALYEWLFENEDQGYNFSTATTTIHVEA